MAQSLIKVSQKNQHVIVKNAGGLKGDTGDTGPVGPMGPMGPVGPQGEKGDAASVTVGSTTTTAPGTSALVTNSGDVHDAVLNFMIPRGETGEMGPQGSQGPQGERGATGAQGPKGETGATGAQGIQGPQGPQGPQGIQGPQGEKGDAGAGLVITGSVATYADLPNDLTPADAGKAYFCQADGKLYVWSGTAFPADGEGSQFEGPQGPQGPQGPAGPAGTYTAGSNITISGDTISATDTTYTAGANVSISQENVISATDTTYSNFTGTDGVDAGTAGLVPAPATTDAGKYLKADGTWGTVSGGIPTDATFWGVSYDSVNNRVLGNINFQGFSNPAIQFKNGSYGIFYQSNRMRFYNGSEVFFIDSSSLNMVSHKITNLADPTAAQDAATKNYVDTAVAGVTIPAYTTSEFNTLWSNA